MALTKTQINYLESKLERIVTEKIENFKKGLGNKTTEELEILKGLKDGSIKLLSEDKIIKIFENAIMDKKYYYASSFNIEDLINKKDRDRIYTEVNKREKLITDYTTRLVNAKQSALDKIVLHGIDVETAMKELDKVN